MYLRNVDPEARIWTLYMHVNKINGKKYVGITFRPVKERWLNGTGYRRCPKFNNAIKKYGWDGFEHIIIKTGLNMQEANDAQIEYIAKYHTRDRDHGYNIAKGGINGVTTSTKVYQYDFDGNFVKEHSSMAEASKQVGCLFSAIGHCCEADSTERQAAGYMWFYEYKGKKIQKYHHYKAKNVCQYDFNGNFIKEWPSANQAQKGTGVSSSHILQCCKGILNKTGGYIWNFDKYDQLPEDILLDILTNHGKFKPVYQYDKQGNFIASFLNSEEAERVTKICAGTIRNVCNHGENRKSAGGYIWSFSYYDKMPEDELIKYKRKNPNK